MYKVFFSSSISNSVKQKIINVLNKYYFQIQNVIRLSDQEIEILIHYSDAKILDGEANMLQRYLIFHVTEDFSVDKFLILLAHELFHIAHYDFFGVRDTSLDVIVDEGMAVVVENNIRKQFKLQASTQNQLWKKRLNHQEKINLLQKAICDETFFDNHWVDLLMNNELRNPDFADNSIYQIGFWLVNEVMRTDVLDFEAVFVKDKQFWEAKTKAILQENGLTCK